MASDFAAYVVGGSEAGTRVEQWVPGTGATETFIPGDLVFFNTTNDEVERCGADPTNIAGIAEVTSEQAKTLTDDGRVPVRVITNASCRVAMSSATTPVVATHVGVAYGLVRESNGHWRVDVSETTTTSVTVVDVDVTNGIWYVVFDLADLQFAGA